MESNVMYLYVYKENPIKSFEPKMLRSTFLVRFHWILWNISVNIIRHGVCLCVRILEGGKKRLKHQSTMSDDSTHFLSNTFEMPTEC